MNEPVLVMQLVTKAYGAKLPISLDVDWIDSLLEVQDDSADQAFHRIWIAQLQDRAIGEAERHFMRSGKQSHWHLFEAYVIHPTRSGGKPKALKDLAQEMGFKSDGQARSALQVVKERLQMILAEEVGKTVATKEDMESELRDIKSML